MNSQHPLITVFTPTFNRAFCLNVLYDSLRNQSFKGFIWMIVDDGSDDNTKELVALWQETKEVDIVYIYKENQGMHSAHNIAYDNITTEISVCIDSDDSMPVSALSIIVEEWKAVRHNPWCAGLIGLDVSRSSGEVIGQELPKNLHYSTIQDIYHKHKITGDKKVVLRTDVVNKFPRYPIYEGENLVPLGTLYLMICQHNKLKCVNKPMCIVEYLVNGSTNKIMHQYGRSPRGFRYAREIELLFLNQCPIRIKKLLHMISSTFYIGDFKYFIKSRYRMSLALLFPFGFFLHVYIIYKSRK